MPLQSGLSPIEGETEGSRPEIVQQRSRDLVRDDSSPFVALKPQAKPYDNFARPEQAPIDNSLKMLAEGLASLNPALQHWADVNAKQDKRGVGDEAARFIAGRKPEEVQADIAAGRVPERLRTQFGTETLRNQQALAQADADAVFLQDWYSKASEADKATYQDKFNSLVAQRAKEYGNQNGFQELYNTRMAAAMNHVARQDLARSQEAFKYEQANATQNAALGVLRTVVDQGLPAQDAAKGVKDLFDANKDWQRLSYKDQQKMLLDAIDPLLGDLDRAGNDKERRDRIIAATREVLTGERVDEKNGIKTRLIEAPEGVGEVARAKLAQLEKKRDELNYKQYAGDLEAWNYNAERHPDKVDPEKVRKWQSQFPGVASEEQINSILIKRQKAIDALGKQALELQAQSQAEGVKNQVVAQDLQKFEDGDFFRVEDRTLPTAKSLMENNTTYDEKFSAEQRRKEVTNAFKRRMDYERAQWLNKGTPKEQVEDFMTARELDRYSQNGMVPDEWKDDMKAGFRQMTASAATGKAPPEITLQQFNRYNLMAEKYPNLVREATDETTREFYEMARACRHLSQSRVAARQRMPMKLTAVFS
ncbi:hypothetical protein [Methylobacterium sp. ID0610]|uniref:hypothetical protein n=1 Tax=Methylobacterium carpenticola TaxID=3344827 RepID=UPI0036C1C37E